MQAPLRGTVGPGSRCLVVATLALVLASPVEAVDRPVEGDLLALRATARGNKLRFVSRDPNLPFPAPSTQNDPGTGDPGGMVVEIIIAHEGADTLSAPVGSGNPGWRQRAGQIRSHRYSAASGGELRKVFFREGRLLRIWGDVDFPLDEPLGAVAVRVTTGFLRSCAVFGGASVRRDQPGRFVARKAPAPEVADCTDRSLAAALGFECGFAGGACGGTCPGDGVCVSEVTSTGDCHCAFPGEPCGQTAPACNGECALGDRCWSMNGFIPGPVDGCLCAPADTPPCGASGVACEDGACPAGLVCGFQPGAGFYDSHCACVEPEQTCGPGYGTCPRDLACQLAPGELVYQCIPTFCGGTFPTCSGDCGPAATCVPLTIDAGNYCVCTALDSNCDRPACDQGLACPAGEVCTVSAGSCSCEP